MSLSQEENSLVQELELNGPIMEHQVPALPTTKIDFCKEDLDSLIEKKIAVRIRVKGQKGFIALREPDPS